jgi:peptidoglycan hydrolase-like protein with peptidoglycan-binding domain
MYKDIIVNEPIRALQQMLRAISFVHPEVTRIIPDGIFGVETKQAVSEFQQMAGLPVTGEANLATFESIVKAYDSAMELLSPAQAPIILFPATLEIQPGQSHPFLYLVQAMLLALRQEFPEFLHAAASGHLDGATQQNLKLLQVLSALPVTGALDIRSYNMLSRLFRNTFDRNSLPAYG